MVSITINVPIPGVDELERELAGARRVISTLGTDKASLQNEVVRLNEGRVAAGIGQFSAASYYALRSRLKEALREKRDLLEQISALKRAGRPMRYRTADGVVHQKRAGGSVCLCEAGGCHIRHQEQTCQCNGTGRSPCLTCGLTPDIPCYTGWGVVANVPLNAWTNRCCSKCSHNDCAIHP